MLFIIILVLLILSLDVLALRWGSDSRDMLEGKERSQQNNRYPLRV